jgi:Mg2+ and Co2+ transporter CorA
MTKEEFEAKRQELKNLMEQKQTELRNQIQAKREELKSQIEAKRTELKNRLAKVKDENKKRIVERVYNQINELNKRMTDHFLNVLEKLEKALERISSRAAKAEANGRDISAVRTAINEATNAIAVSRTAVQNQAAKIYALTINTENTLKTDVGKIRQTLHSDLMAVQKIIKSVQEAVRKAATTLAQIPKVDELEAEATTTQPIQ